MDVVFVASWFPSRMNPELGNFVQRHAEALAHTGTNVKVIHIVYSNRILFPKMEEKMLGGIEIIHFFLPKIGMKSTLLIDLP